MSVASAVGVVVPVLTIAARLIEMVLDLVPVEEARAMLDDAAVKRGRAVADLIEVERGLR